jgi:hypothetical protein
MDLKMGKAWVVGALALAMMTAGCNALLGIQLADKDQGDGSVDGSATEGGSLTDAPSDRDGAAHEGAAGDSAVVGDGSGGTDGSSPPAAQLSVGSTTLDFGTLTTHQTVSPGTIDVTNTGNAPTATLTTALTGAAYSVSKDGCAGTALAPQAVCHIQIALDDSAAGMPAGTFTITDSATDTLTVRLEADIVVPGALSISPQSFDFHSWAIGSTSPAQVFTVTNTGMTASGMLSVVQDPTNGTTAAEFATTDGCSGKTLMANATCTVTVVFAPASRGAKSATLVVNATPGGPATASLTGTGLGPAALTILPTSYAYVPAQAGSPGPSETFAVTNNGDVASAPLTTGLAYGPTTASTEFVITGDACAGTQLAAAASCNIVVQFDPATFGAKSATLNINGGTPSAALTGTGKDSLTLTVVKNGTGGGTVADTTSAINCGTTCSASFARTTSDPVVMLTATPDSTSTFAGWSGGGCTGTGPCSVTLSAATTVTATFNTQQETLTVNFRALGVGQASAAITSSPAGISCTGKVCTTSAGFNVGQVVTLTVTGLGAGALSAWVPGTCTATTGVSCTVTMSAAETVSYTATNNNIVFVSSQSHSGNFGGLAGANTFCQGLASAGGLPGRYVAFLGTQAGSTITPPFANLGSARGWVRPDGLAFTDTVANFENNGISWYPPSITDLGNVVTTGELLYVGYFLNSSCTNWIDGTSTTVNTGFSPANEGIWWMGLEGGSCASGNVTCFGTDFTATAVSVTPVAGRHAFVSTAAFTPSGGRNAADALCQSEATTAGLANPSHFLAALSETTASAASRFSLTGATWVRPDGVQLAATPTDFMNATLMAPVYVGPSGAPAGSSFPFNANIWTGSSNGLNAVSASAAESCEDWTSATITTGGYIGQSSVGTSGAGGGGGAFAWAEVGCTMPEQLLCLEN